MQAKNCQRQHLKETSEDSEKLHAARRIRHTTDDRAMQMFGIRASARGRSNQTDENVKA